MPLDAQAEHGATELHVTAQGGARHILDDPGSAALRQRRDGGREQVRVPRWLSPPACDVGIRLARGRGVDSVVCLPMLRQIREGIALHEGERIRGLRAEVYARHGE